MKIQGNTKTAIFAIALAILMATSTYAFTPSAHARQVPYTIATYAFVAIYPQPIALGQTFYVSMWLDQVPPTANWEIGDRWLGFMLKITEPNGVVVTLGPFTSDAAGGASTTYTPTMVGNYTFVFSWPGMTLTGGPGYPADANLINNPGEVGQVYAGATSSVVTATVGTVAATTIPENPLPTGYWQCPVEAFNHLWYVLDGNWLGVGGVGQYDGALGDFNNYTQAPLTSHIIWTMPEAFGGQIGGLYGSVKSTTQASLPPGNEQSNYVNSNNDFKFYPIIIDGYLYTTWTPNQSGLHVGFECIDLATGKIVYTVTTTDTLMCGQVMYFESESEYGGFAYLWATTTTAGLWHVYDAFTGNLLFSITGATTGTMYSNPSTGDIMNYYINSTAGTAHIGTPYAYAQNAVQTIVTATGQQALYLWNSSLCIGKTIANYVYGTQSFAPALGASIPFWGGVEWAVNLPTTFQGKPLPKSAVTGTTQSWAIFKIDQTDGVLILDISGEIYGADTPYSWNIEAGYTMGSTYERQTYATQLWMVNRTFAAPVFLLGTSASCGDGTYIEYYREAGIVEGYSVTTGASLWTSQPLWVIYPNAGAELAYYDDVSGLYAGGYFYVWTLGGQVFCFAATTGKVEWVWSTGSAGLNTPYGEYPLWIKYNWDATVAGDTSSGMVLTVSSGHEYGPPMFNGAQLWALNATVGGPQSGTLIWSNLDWAIDAPVAIADGHAVAWNGYDDSIYCYGKGNSATTVTTQPGINTDQVLITGTVTDQSPGQTCLGIPEAGTPAISDASMSQWMQYLFEQSPKPTNATGVPVTLTDIDPNGNTYTIGTTTSDINGQYSFAFTPNVAGKYTIVATFGGTNSYYASSGETYFLWNTPPTPAPPYPTAPTGIASTGTVELGVAAIVIIIIIIGAVLAVLTLRKRP